MQPLEALALARSEFVRRLQAVTPDDWIHPTPCDDWTVHDLVLHVVSGDRMAAALVRGATRAEATALRQTVDLGDDALAAFNTAADWLAAAFAEPGAFERVCAHPSGLFDTGAQLLGFRIGDYALHAWDLARAIGADETLDDAVVEAVWTALQPVGPLIGSSGVFGAGPTGHVTGAAPLQARLLDLTGRRP